MRLAHVVKTRWRTGVRMTSAGSALMKSCSRTRDRNVIEVYLLCDSKYFYIFTSVNGTVLSTSLRSAVKTVLHYVYCNKKRISVLSFFL